MKLLTFFAAVCLMGMASCSQKTCPAYSKGKSHAPTHYAKNIVTSKADASRM
jgi:hypothetical protein